MARNIWSLLVKFNITAEVKHIPGKNNGMADRLSHIASEADIGQFRSEFPNFDFRVLFPHWCHLNPDI